MRLNQSEIKKLNSELEGQSAETIIKKSYEIFGSKLYSLSSFGADSAIMFRLLEKAGLEIPILTIDTGFWFEETYFFMDEMVDRHNLKVHVYGPSKEEVGNIKKEKLWEKNVDKYHQVTKLRPLSKAIEELGVEGLMSGVRRSQTKNRAKLKTISEGSDGEIRIHPILSWSEKDVDDFFQSERLLKHPLYWQGYGSIGDYTTTKPGTGREGRSGLGVCLECGIHLKR